MPTVMDLGKQGPHPDVLTSLVERINELLPEVLHSDGDDEVRESGIRVLQQRTLYGLNWSNLWGGSWGYDSDVVDVDVSVGLVVSATEGSRKQLVMYWAHRLPDRDWAVARMSIKSLDDPPIKPWPGFTKLGRGLGISLGALVPSHDLGNVQLTLEDGQVHESAVSNGSVLIFVPFSSAELWSSAVTFGFYDTEGREILTESLPLDLESLNSA